MIKIELSNEINGLKNEYELDLYNNHYKKSSIISYMYDITLFINYITYNTTINTLSALDEKLIKEFFNYLFLERKNSKRTLLRKFNTINNFLYYCQKQGKISLNPMKKMDKPEYDIIDMPIAKADNISKLLKNAINQETLTDRQKTLSQYYSLRDIAIISLIISTGISVGELTLLDLDDINFKDNVVHSQSGKLFINETTKKNLQKYIEEERQSYDDSLRALFISSRGVRTRLSIRSVQRIIKKYSSNINENLTPQAIRKVYNHKYTEKLDNYKDQLRKQLTNELEKIVIENK
ncbi:MAG: phage integrase SAM-like domain-containing protein [Agathobacter sp.]|nr:phage integrase SAM-like domain-containing protein [Agathobacter sp.]